MCTEQTIFSGVFPRRRSVNSIQTTTFYDSDRRELLINFDRGPYFRRLTSIVRADNRQWFTRNRDDFRLKFRNAISNFIVFERNSNDNTSLCCAEQARSPENGQEAYMQGILFAVRLVEAPRSV